MNVTAREPKSIAVIVGSVAVAAAAITVGVLQGSANSETFAGDMSTGVTVTATTAPSEAPIPAAAPAITGPAPLPLEEQGLPG
ncbi:hypothetical protein ABIA65_001999 [Mycolicibacterium sp. 624]